MTIENVTAPLIDPLIITFHQILSMLSVLIGGLFGLSILFFVVRFLQDRKQMRILRGIQTDMALLKTRLDALYEAQEGERRARRGRSHGR